MEVIQHGVKSFHWSKCVWGDTRVHSDMLQLALKSDTIEQWYSVTRFTFTFSKPNQLSSPDRGIPPDPLHTGTRAHRSVTKCQTSDDNNLTHYLELKFLLSITLFVLISFHQLDVKYEWKEPININTLPQQAIFHTGSSQQSFLDFSQCTFFIIDGENE